MKKAIKIILACLILAIVYMIINGLTYSFFPFTDWFKERNASQESNLIPILFVELGTVATICFITVNAKSKGIWLYLGAIGSVYFIQTFMTQIETMVFQNAFTGLATSDILLMMVADFCCILMIGLLMILLLKKKSSSQRVWNVSLEWKKVGKRIFINGLIYMVIYFIFGYFVAWKSEALRIFYSGQATDYGFIHQLYSNLCQSPMIYPIQLIRGMLFTVGVIPLMKINWNRKLQFEISVCAVFLLTAIGLLIPNFLFPDAVRLRHFIEMISSMLLFGIITAKFMGPCRKIPIEESGD